MHLAYSVLDHELNICHSIFTPVTCLLRTTLYLDGNLHVAPSCTGLGSFSTPPPATPHPHHRLVVAEKDRWVAGRVLQA